MHEDRAFKIIARLYVEAGGDPEDLLKMQSVGRDWEDSRWVLITTEDGARVQVPIKLLEDCAMEAIRNLLLELVPEHRRRGQC